LRFRVGQGFDCRPQLIDQRLAIADFSALFSVQALATLLAERRWDQKFESVFLQR
jgi:hypothetical protein